MTAPTLRRVFSERLESFLDDLKEGETPNAGRFCGFCFNPIPPDQTACDHCGRSLTATTPVTSVPDPIIEMHRRKQKRESLVVNSFAYLGLAIGLALFLLVVAINFYYVDQLWLLIASVLVLLVGGRMLAGLIGGYIGDELGYRYANRKLADEWDAFLAQKAER